MKIKIFDLLYFFAVLSTVVLFFNYFPLNEDSKWILHCADEMTKGAILYVDKIDVNPPLIFIYSIFAVFISKITFLSLINSYILLVILIICFSLYLCWKILDDIFKDDNSKIRVYLYTLHLHI